MSQLINITDSSTATAGTLQCEDQLEGFMAWGFFTGVFFIWGFPGAVAVLLDMFQKGRNATPFTPHDVFMLNLTVMDGLYFIFLPLDLFNHLQWNNYEYEAFISFLFSFHLCGRPLFLTCICLDCYLAVVHPVKCRARKSLTPRILMAVGVWIVTVSTGLYFITTYGVVDGLTQIIFFALTLPVIAYCDFSILRTLKGSNPGGGDVHPQKKKALQIIIHNLIITIISYMPPIITLVVFQFLNIDRNVIVCLMVIPLMSITVLGNALSPILHLNNLGKLDWLKCWRQK